MNYAIGVGLTLGVAIVAVAAMSDGRLSAQGAAADPQGNVYAGFTGTQNFKRFVKK
jgi:hypothetical protein